MKIIVTGPTGTAGSEVITQALADPRVEQITAISRRPLAVEHRKLKTVILKDFLDYSSIQSELQGHDACLFCLGISQKHVDAATYRTITFDFAVAGLKGIRSASPEITFCFLSAKGADSSEKSRVLFARVKGEAENALLAIGSPGIYIFRPGYIEPTVRLPHHDRYERIMKKLSPFFHLVFPGFIVTSADLARAMIDVGISGGGNTIVTNSDIKERGRR